MTTSASTADSAAGNRARSKKGVKVYMGPSARECKEREYSSRSERLRIARGARGTQQETGGIMMFLFAYTCVNQTFENVKKARRVSSRLGEFICCRLNSRLFFHDPG